MTKSHVGQETLSKKLETKKTSWIYLKGLLPKCLKTHIEAMHAHGKLVGDLNDALHEDPLDVLVKVAIQDGVGACGGQANNVTDHVCCHETL